MDLLQGLIFRQCYIDFLCMNNNLFYSVHKKHLYTPPAYIEPCNIYEVLDFLLFRLFIYETL